MSARLDTNASSPNLIRDDRYVSLVIWMTLCDNALKNLQLINSTNKASDVQNDINNLLFFEELILIVQQEMIIINNQILARQKIDDFLLMLEGEKDKNSYIEKIKISDLSQQELQNQQQKLSILKTIEVQKAISNLNEMRTKLIESVNLSYTRLNIIQSNLNKINSRIDNSLQRVLSNFNEVRVDDRIFSIENIDIDIDRTKIYQQIGTKIRGKFADGSINENDLKNLVKDEFRTEFQEFLRLNNQVNLSQSVNENIERELDNEYSDFLNYISNHSDGHSIIRDLQVKESFELKRDNEILKIARYQKNIDAINTQVENFANVQNEFLSDAISYNSIEKVIQASENLNNFSNQLSEEIQDIEFNNDDLEEMAALFGDSENVNSIQAEDNIIQHPAPPGGPAPINDDLPPGPPGGIPIPENEPLNEPHPVQNEIKSQPVDVKPKSSTLSALQRLGIGKSEMLEKKESDKKIEEAKKTEQQPNSMDKKIPDHQGRPDEPQRVGPKFGK